LLKSVINAAFQKSVSNAAKKKPEQLCLKNKALATLPEQAIAMALNGQ